MGRAGQKKYIKEFDGEASKGKIRLERFRSRWVDDIKMNLKELEWGRRRNS